MNHDLYKLSRAAETALDAAKSLIRPVLRGTRLETASVYTEFRYTFPNVNQYETTLRKRYDALRTAMIQAQIAPPQVRSFELAMAETFLAGVRAKTASDENKERLAAKRIELAARAKQKAELGVDLTKFPKATEATYRALRASVEPIRVSVEEHLVEVLTQRHLILEEAIAKAGSFNAAWPKFNSHPRDIWFFFREDRNAKYGVVSQPDLADRIRVKAKTRSTEEVEAFAAKLTQKIDTDADGKPLSEVGIRTCNHRGLWEHSLVDVRLSDASVQTWYTQIIWNHSCLGKSFNQWPTRQIKS